MAGRGLVTGAVLAAVFAAGCSGASSASSPQRSRFDTPTGTVVLQRSGNGDATYEFSAHGSQHLTYQATCVGGRSVTLSGSQLHRMTTSCPYLASATIDGTPSAKKITLRVSAQPDVHWRVTVRQGAHHL